MSIVALLLSTVLVSNYGDVAGVSIFLGSKLNWAGSKNSLFGTEIIFQGAEAEWIYDMERSDQTQKVERAQKKVGRTNQSSDRDNLNKLVQESKKNKFCDDSILNTICERGFQNSYFIKNQLTLDTASPSECVEKEVTTKQDKTPHAYTRQLVTCKTTGEKGASLVFFDAFTIVTYASKTLKFFVINEEGGQLRPKAFLMNKPEPKAPKAPKATKSP